MDDTESEAEYEIYEIQPDGMHSHPEFNSTSFDNDIGKCTVQCIERRSMQFRTVIMSFHMATKILNFFFISNV